MTSSGIAEALVDVEQRKLAGDVQGLIRLLSVPTESGILVVRSAAARALGDLRADEAVPDLISLLDDANEDVRISAAVALGKIRDEGSAGALVRAIGDASEPVRAWSVWALGRIGDQSVVPSLVSLPSNESWWIRLETGKVLAAIGDPRALRPLEAAVRRESGRRRWRMARAARRLRRKLRSSKRE